MSYALFLDAKSQTDVASGFDPAWLPEWLFPFQMSLVEWAIRQGRAAIFADCGLGKTPMQLVWAENVRRHTGRPVLIVTPLAVGSQTVDEAAKFGIEAAVSRDGSVAAAITITNYERLERFDPASFGGVVCDESSAIKSFDGVRRSIVTDFLRKHRYRLLCTATAAPNDYIELGTSSEALGYLGHMDMLGRFFVSVDKTSSPMKGRWRFPVKERRSAAWSSGWRFKGHAEDAFWRWVASWARAMRRPSDHGFEDDGFVLPPLVQDVSVVRASVPPDGTLFDLPAIGLAEEREELRRTLRDRCERAAELLTHDRPAVAWCHLNPEGDLLAKLIPGAVQVSGADSIERKEDVLSAFGRGDIRVLVTKPKIGAWGLNWQHAAHTTYFPSHSYEQFYQAVRRMWRFGQRSPVRVDIVTTEGGRDTLANLERKAAQADRMFDALVAHMRGAMSIDRTASYPHPVEVPAWLS